MLRMIIASLILVSAVISTQASAANEIMTDRCSRDVAIVPSYNSTPDRIGSLILRRDSSDQTVWTQPFFVTTSSDGYIRWWCHSTTGNWIDPGTWRIEELNLGTACNVDANFQHPSSCEANGALKSNTSASIGWTAERSRCSNHSNVLKAHLGPDRLLQFECLPPNQQGIAQALTSSPPSTSTTCFDTVQDTIAWDYNGSTHWDPSNLNSLCAAAESSREPAWCFLHTMFGGVNWGGGTQWYWGNARDLCRGSHDAFGTISCFEAQIAAGAVWWDAIAACNP